MRKQKTVLTDTRDREAFHGYLIARSPFDGNYRVSKDGFHIATFDTSENAKRAIREITDRV